MKKLLILFSFLILAGCTYSQDKKILNLPIPHYKILKVDSTYVTQDAIDRHKPVMIIYFGPDCPHCQRLMAEMKENMSAFKDIQIVMITFTRTEFPYLNMIKDFSKTYDLPKYKNITMGTEYPDYKVQRYYQVTGTPFVAIYDRNGKMVKYFDKPPKIADVVAAVKKVTPVA